jgi:hypothetical protein
MEALSTSEKSVNFYQAARHYNPEGSQSSSRNTALHTHRKYQNAGQTNARRWLLIASPAFVSRLQQMDW